MLQFIVSGRDTKFTISFLKHLFCKVGIKLLFNITFHPQTDGQIERVNGVLNQYLKNYVNIDKKRLERTSRHGRVLLNLHVTHLAIKMSLFELALGREAKKSMDLTIPMGRRNHSKEVVEMVKGREKNIPKPRSS
jgi:hypothetical protein